jgi:hypothetical protein
MRELVSLVALLLRNYTVGSILYGYQMANNTNQTKSLILVRGMVICVNSKLVDLEPSPSYEYTYS